MESPSPGPSEIVSSAAIVAILLEQQPERVLFVDARTKKSYIKSRILTAYSWDASADAILQLLLDRLPGCAQHAPPEKYTVIVYGSHKNTTRIVEIFALLRTQCSPIHTYLLHVAGLKDFARCFPSLIVAPSQYSLINGLPRLYAAFFFFNTWQAF